MSNNIRYWRNERGLSQFELAAASGVPRWKIQLIELGVAAPNKDERQTLSLALGKSENELFEIGAKNG